MSLWERDYMHERWRKMHLSYGEDDFAEPRVRTARGPSGIPAVFWIFVLALVVSMLAFLIRAASSIWSGG